MTKEQKPYCDCIPCCDCCYGWCADCDICCFYCNENCCRNPCCTDCCTVFSKIIDKMCVFFSAIFCCFPIQWNYWRKPLPGHKRVEKEWMNIIQSIISANEGNKNILFDPKLEWSKGLLSIESIEREYVHAAAVDYIHKVADEIIKCAEESSRRVWFGMRRDKSDRKLLLALDKLSCFKDFRHLYSELTKKESDDFDDYRLYDNIICALEHFKHLKRYTIEWESYRIEIEADVFSTASGKTSVYQVIDRAHETEQLLRKGETNEVEVDLKIMEKKALLEEEYPDLIESQSGSDKWKNRKEKRQKRNTELFNLENEVQVRNVINTLNRVFERPFDNMTMKEEYLCDSIDMIYNLYKEMKTEKENEEKKLNQPDDENPFEEDKDQQINRLLRTNKQLEEQIEKLMEEKRELEEKMNLNNIDNNNNVDNKDVEKEIEKVEVENVEKKDEINEEKKENE